MVHFAFQPLCVFEMTDKTHRINIGDLVRYRDWRPGDDLSTRHHPRKAWGRSGIVVAIEDWVLGHNRYPNEGIVVLDDNSDFMHAHCWDLEVIVSTENLPN